MTALEMAKKWLGYAQNDLIVARHSFEDLYPKQTEISCYHCQQCAEKALKSFLILNDTDPPKTHNLEELCGLCISTVNDFSTIQNICLQLNPYGVVTRYPNELAIDELITKAAIERAQTILDFCVAKIGVQADK
jgi:HEPN domain-containing protein